MIGKSTLSLILPCRNEALALKKMLSEIPSYIDEIIVVDNGSSDKTQEVCSAYNVRFIKEPRSHNGVGYGYAHLTGIKAAKGDILICMDADGSYPLQSVKRIVKKLEDLNLDFISCNRIPLTVGSQIYPLRRGGILFINFVFRLMHKYAIKDALSGMWVFRRGAIKNLTLSDGGWNFSLEIKLRAIADPQVKFREFSIPYHDRYYGKSKQNLIKTGLTHVLYLITTSPIFKRKTPSKLLNKTAKVQYTKV